MREFNERLIKRYAGFDTKRDEYQTLELHNLIAKCNVLSFYLIIIAIWLSTFFDVYMQQVSIGTFILGGLLLFILIFNGSQAKKLTADKNGLIEYYDEKQYNQIIRLVKFQFLNLFLAIFTCNFCLSTYMDAWIDNRPMFIHWTSLIGSFVESFILIIAGYYIYKMMLQKRY